MRPLTRDDLYSLEEYAQLRPGYRAEVLAHKKDRKVTIGAHATLSFEDRSTIQYQVQEMLRIERIFEAAGIEEELAAYNPLIPDGGNLKATFMLEYSDVEARRVALEQELRDLLIHGVLHLLGMDHERPADARHMKALEEHLRWTLAAFD